MPYTETEHETDETPQEDSVENGMLENLIMQLNTVVHQKELTLQTEESGTLIAKLQGYIAGARKYKSLMSKSGFAHALTEAKSSLFFTVDYAGNEKCELNPMGVESSFALVQELIHLPEYKDFEKKRTEAVESAKNALFFKSEKGRDLYWYRDWYKALTQIDEWIAKLSERFYRLQNEKEQAAKKAKEELPFEYMEE